MSGSIVRRLLIAALLLAMLPVSAFAADPAASPVASSGNWWDGAVCYQIFVRSFNDSDGDGIGDFVGVIEKLDYLNDGDPATTNDLGVTCIWLMPVFSATNYHGYDVEDYYAVEPDYGTDADFDRLIADAHARGIRVMLDLVLNHTSVNNPWFQSALRDPASPYRDWYIFEPSDPGYAGPWGADAWHRSPVADEYYYGIFWEGMPDLNYRNPEVTAEAERISAFWLDRGVDGFRLDAIRYLIEDGKAQQDTPATHDWWRSYRAFLDRAYPEAYTVGEIFDAGAFVLEPYYPDQLRAYFQFEMAGQFLISAQQGVAGGIAYVVKDALAKQPAQPWATFLSNHDQNRTMSQLFGDVAQAKLAASALLTTPGTPFIYYGEEIGMTGAKPDELIRTPMQWAPEPGGGFTSGEPWQPVTSVDPDETVAGQDADPNSLLNHYRALVQLRAAHPALGSGGFVELETNNSAVLAFLRTSPDEDVLVVINFGDEPVSDLTLSVDEDEYAGGDVALSPLFGSDGELNLTLSDTEAPFPTTFAAQSTTVYEVDSTPRS